MIGNFDRSVEAIERVIKKCGMMNFFMSNRVEYILSEIPRVEAQDSD